MTRVFSLTGRQLALVGLAVVALVMGLAGAGGARAQSTQRPRILRTNLEQPSADRFIPPPTLFTLADNPTWFVAGKTGTLAHPGSLRWTWTTREAVANGAFWVYLLPLAEGRSARYPMTITFSDPQTLSGHLAFTRLSIRITGAKVPKGYTRVMDSHVGRVRHSRYYSYF
jgi:hypothetical protein